ncbi:disulfide bond formation protein B [Acidithiobacillus ferrooxidans F221]|nr:disulfide bond formation protein B [Acidithiobacillus ferrooxidans F221]
MERPARRFMSPARLSGLIAVLVAGAAAGAFVLVLWLQFARGDEPCSLCVYQRLANVAVLLIVGMGFFWTGAARRGLWILASVYALAGAGLAGWQWHLSAIASHAPEACTAVDIFRSGGSFGPWGNEAASVFSGQGSCAAAGARTLAGWPVTHWSLVFFLTCTVLLWLAQWLSGRQDRR